MHYDYGIEEDATIRVVILIAMIAIYMFVLIGNVHFILATSLYIFANYMYSLAPNNPLVELFMQWIPGGYWHMYLAVPILVVYLLIVYAPDILRAWKKKKTA